MGFLFSLFLSLFGLMLAVVGALEKDVVVGCFGSGLLVVGVACLFIKER
jgi:hypothetical protein